MSLSSPSAPFAIGRYAFHGEIASGGMATVHFARLLGPGGFSRIVAAKRLLSHLVKDQEFTAMLMDEARLAARIRHPNVVSTLDVVSTGDELLVVMDYVHGESVAKLSRTASDLGEPVPHPIAAAIIIDALRGLHAAHEVRDESGELLGVVHRDVSPHNLLVGVDGVTRVADFGIAMATGRSHQTRDGAVKGKLSYMAPEQIERGDLTAATDVFAISVVLWELLAGQRLWSGNNDGALVNEVLNGTAPSLRDLRPDLPPAYDAIVQRGLAKDPAARFQSARDMALELEAAAPPVRASEVGAWVERIASDTLVRRSRTIAKIERTEASEDQPVPLNAGQTRSVARPLSLTPAATPEGAGTGAQVSWAQARAGVGSGEEVVPSAPPERKSKRAPYLLLAAGVTLAGAAAYWIALRIPASGPTVELRALPSAPASPHDVVSASHPAPSVAPASAPETEPSVSAKPARVAPKAPAKAAAAAKPAKAAKNCDPPYSIDASGRRLFKLECM